VSADFEFMDRQRYFGFLLKDLSRLYVQRFEERARSISRTLPQCKVLVRLEDNEGVSQARLAEVSELDPMTMVRIVDRMEADGLLERRPDPEDRRARCMYLTAKGRSLLDEVWRLAEETRAEIFAGVARADREVFMKVLAQLHGNACEFGELTEQPERAAAKPAAPRRNANR
jgi:DNA-binding MarR family transcriptional regulator